MKEHKPNWKKIKEVPVIGDVIRILSFFYSGLRVIALTAEKVGDKAVNTIPEAVVSCLHTLYCGVCAKISAHGGAPGQPPPAEGVSQGVKADSDVEKSVL